MEQDRWTANTISCSSMRAAHDRLSWGSAIVCREYLKEVSRCMIQVARYVSLNDPLVGVAGTAGQSFADVGHGVIGASIGPESIGMGAKVGFPYGFQDHPEGFLYNPVQQDWDASGPLFLTVGLWDVYPFHRRWFKCFGFE